MNLCNVKVHFYTCYLMVYLIVCMYIYNFLFVCIIHTLFVTVPVSLLFLIRLQDQDGRHKRR